MGTDHELNDATADESYEQAIDTIRLLIAVLHAVRALQAETDKADELRRLSLRYAEEERQLHVTDRLAVARVIEEYPALIRQYRAALQRER